MELKTILTAFWLSTSAGVWVTAPQLHAGGAASSREYHVEARGDDGGDGSASAPLRTLSAAAERAQPGDTITVHEGVYRERVSPPRGGESEQTRILYRAAPGEKVVLKGSEVVKGWKRVQHDTWKVVVPNEVFGGFNPYSDLIHGDWFNAKGRKHHTGAVYLEGFWLTEATTRDEVLKPAGEKALWFGEVGADSTNIWAQFRDVDPNQVEVEINVRQTVFYPEKPGVDYVTVRGFTMMHAATPWAPPTAEQIGLIGTHWSKGWIIEHNDIRHSTCVGITLGKHGDQYDNTSQNTAQGYVKTIERAVERHWSKETVGHHVVRDNRISHCEQAGIVGSLGAVFSTITRNVIHDIHVRQLFTGAEMAGIKIHAAIDMTISDNHIYRTCRGIWLDWMAQGTRVTRNLLHDNSSREDLFVEVNHGPFLIDHNIFLSARSLTDWSQGGAYAHNLFAGRITLRPELRRSTPFHEAHSTVLAGLTNIPGGDDRFYNNLLSHPTGLTAYDKAAQPVQMAGNLFLGDSRPSRHEQDPSVLSSASPEIELTEKTDGLYLKITLDEAWRQGAPRQLVTTERLGRAKVPDLPYEQPDGSPYRLEVDYFGSKHSAAKPSPGPFALSKGGPQEFKVWPVARAGGARTSATPRYEAELVFPLHSQHNHAPGIVECPNGDLLVSWYRGSGERRADDVAVYGARKRKAATSWSEPFVMVDFPEFPDGNTALHIDRKGDLWLFWPTILANTWESCLTQYRVASDFEKDGPPTWRWQSVILLKPRDFEQEMTRRLGERLAKARSDKKAVLPGYSPEAVERWLEELRGRVADKLSRRLGWQPRCKPTVLPSGRILLPLYSDTYSVSIMAISDDEGASWYASGPLAGFGNIQPAVLRRDDGTLVAYMRENGPLDRVRVCESSDDGLTWGAVGVAELPNPGSGLDALVLQSGQWLIVYNDTTSGRKSLAVSLSDDEGASWRWSRHLEREEAGAYHYPAVIQSRDGTLHVVYSYFVGGGKSMKHAGFNEAWVRAGDPRLSHEPPAASK